MKYILASGSPRRKELLTLAGYRFDICVPNVEERMESAWTADEAACALSIQKAMAVGGQFPRDCVIAADTVVALEGMLLGKPHDAAEAAHMLGLLSGREHRVITGVCLQMGPHRRVFSQETHVRFYALQQAEIEAYVATGEPMDKAGAYGIQGRGALLVEGIRGDYCNVVGLPIARLVRELSAFTGLTTAEGGSACICTSAETP